MESPILAIALIHVSVALVLTLVNLTVTNRRLTAGLNRDSGRFRLALRTELAELLALQGENLRHLRHGRDFLLSNRACMGVYRANLGRVSLLRETEIPAIVAAYAASEKAEHYLAATTKAVGGMAHRTTAETPLKELTREMRRAESAVRAALFVMDGDTPGPAETAQSAAAMVPMPPRERAA